MILDEENRNFVLSYVTAWQDYQSDRFPLSSLPQCDQRVEGSQCDMVPGIRDTRRLTKFPYSDYHWDKILLTYFYSGI